jgi:hypothetical protein
MIFDLNKIREELNTVDSKEDCRTVYLGTYISLFPSKKSPFCFRTNLEIEQDHEWFEKANLELESIGCFLAPGSDLCDFYAVDGR